MFYYSYYSNNKWKLKFFFVNFCKIKEEKCELIRSRKSYLLLGINKCILKIFGKKFNNRCYFICIRKYIINVRLENPINS